MSPSEKSVVEGPGNFSERMGDVLVISLTATPPYDATPAQWERYCKVCGPVDEEISVPELVKEGSLCLIRIMFILITLPGRRTAAKCISQKKAGI